MEKETDMQQEEMFIAELRDCAKSLIENLQQEDYENASKLIQGLAQTRDRDIFQSVGKLTRGLHNAIVNFHVDGEMDAELAKTESSGMQDASDRLNYVIDLTRKAADRTMDIVEAATPVATDLRQEAAQLKEDWTRLKSRDMRAAEFRGLYKRMEDFLDKTDTGTEQLSQYLQDIILEQGFQDLTGQVLRRVIELIRDVERDLVGLVRIAGQVEDITGLADDADKDKAPKGKVQATRDVVPEGPQIHADLREDVVSGQDDVDDLLSSLGF